MDDQTQREIISKSFKAVFKYKKIFTQITITLFLPLTILFIAHMHLSNRFFHKIEQTPYCLLTGAFRYYKSYFTVKATLIDWIYYLLFKFITIVSITFFSLLSTAMIVYTLASLYTGIDVTRASKGYANRSKGLETTYKHFHVSAFNFFHWQYNRFYYSILIARHICTIDCSQRW